MSTPKESSRKAARIALRLSRHTHNRHLTSYLENDRVSSSAEETVERDELTPHASRFTPHDSKLSWEDFPDDLWPSDTWVVGADLDPALLPEFWMFLAEGGAR
jgi:hypothetical protein